MKLTVAVAILTVWTLCGFAAAAPTSYSLTCKGGSIMFVEVESDRVYLWFRWANHSATAAPPAEGECAWLDRGGRSGEPTKLLMKHHKFPGLTFDISAQGHITGLSSAADPTTESIVRVLRDVLAKRQFYLRAYASGNFLIVTRYGP